MSFPIRAAMVIPLALVSGCAQRLPQPEPLSWRPTLDQPIRQLEEVQAGTEQQQPMNYARANVGFALDAKLYLLFQDVVSQVDAHEQVPLIEEQRRWLKERAHARDQTYTEFEGGTLASFAGSGAFIEAAKARIAELERRFGPIGARSAVVR
jgi:uncharacterized protein YecT (DUF1311 family)